MKKDTKTNVIRVLDVKKISYKSHTYEPDSTMSGEELDLKKAAKVANEKSIRFNKRCRM